ncbi:MAG TPA: Arc family DNA binding domain-containing protein [Rhodanobacteraceae bacterium]
MADDKKAYPLRISTRILDAVQGWADDELRSVNAQIEYLLREALRKSGRLKPDDRRAEAAKK